MSVSKKLRWLVDSKDPNHRIGIVHYCPACDMSHVVYIAQPIGSPAHAPVWSWNGQFNEQLTTSPSLRTTYNRRFDERLDLPTRKPDHYEQIVEVVCHYFITGGYIVYCGDSTHKLAGVTIPLEDFPPHDD